MIEEMRAISPVADSPEFRERVRGVFVKHGFRVEHRGATDSILIVRLDALGDMVLTSGVIREIRRNYPNAFITLLVQKNVFPLVELCPYVNEVIALEVPKMSAFSEGLYYAVLDFCNKRLWRRRYSICFCPQWGDARANTYRIAFLSGAEKIIGFNVVGNVIYNKLTRKVETGSDESMNGYMTEVVFTPDDMVREAERHFHLLTGAGLRVRDMSMEAWFSKAELENVRSMIGGRATGKVIVALGIGASIPCRRYPVSQYVEAMKMLLSRNVFFLILGGNDVADDVVMIEKAIPAESMMSLVNKTTIRETEAAISISDIYVGNNTSLSHIAAALKVPVITPIQEAKDREEIMPGYISLYARFSPWQTRSRVLRPEHGIDECSDPQNFMYGGCGHHNESHCIAQIRPEQIVEAFDELMKEQ